MKKTVLTLAVALAACCAIPAMAQDEADVPANVDMAEVVTEEADPNAPAVAIVAFDAEGKATINYAHGNKTVTIEAEEYQAEKDRGLTDLKIAKNKEINDADGAGIGVTVMAMCIVLTALIVFSILFMVFGKMFAKMQSQKKKEAHGIETAEADDADDHDSGETIAAIAMALNEHFNSQHDIEDTVLTIRRMKRAYSPWNSKIYNMREVPGSNNRR